MKITTIFTTFFLQFTSFFPYFILFQQMPEPVHQYSPVLSFFSLLISMNNERLCEAAERAQGLEPNPSKYCLRCQSKRRGLNYSEMEVANFLSNGKGLMAITFSVVSLLLCLPTNTLWRLHV